MHLANGDTVKITGGTVFGFHGGGPFTVNGVSVAAGLGDSFQSFCLEENVDFKKNQPYYVSIDTAAKFGGGGAVAGEDPVSSQTAWLYTEFRKGTLSSDVAGFDYASHSSETSLQTAIWYLEDELSGSSLSLYTGDTLAQQLVSAANGSGFNGIGSVRALNLWTHYDATNGTFSGDVQSQLYLVPEPETYAMLMAGLGLMGVIARRRKSSQA